MNDVCKKAVVVVGLGYVGLPLAVALARHFDVIGLDIDRRRVAELQKGDDRTGEVDRKILEKSALKVTADASECRGRDIYIVTVPTPVDDCNKPDLRPLVGASATVGKLLQKGRPAIIVYESTVYPGVTEEICAPLLEKESGLKAGQDFFLGYSPERINPGDREHTVDRITKVVAAENDEVLDVLADLYGTITTGGVFRAASIKAAEAAKVIENAQRDINIAFMNEIAQIFAKLDISVWDVLEAAGTKWNFLKFQPGLVGGHCIGVDPYYLSSRAEELGHRPDVILAGRRINDGMGPWVADQLHAKRGGRAGKVLVMGLTFKEDVPDLRNSKVFDVIRRLEKLGHQVTVHDPIADPIEAQEGYGVVLDADALTGQYDVVFAAVPHREYKELTAEAVSNLLHPNGCLADLKGIWRSRQMAGGIERWSL